MSGSRRHVACTLLILLVMAHFGTPAVWGAPLTETREIGAVSVFARLWEAFTSIWASAEITAPPPSTDAGCKIDPHGGCEPEI
jgi:hypothetical protein